MPLTPNYPSCAHLLACCMANAVFGIDIDIVIAVVTAIVIVIVAFDCTQTNIGLTPLKMVCNAGHLELLQTFIKADKDDRKTLTWEGRCCCGWHRATISLFYFVCGSSHTTCVCCGQCECRPTPLQHTSLLHLNPVLLCIVALVHRYQYLKPQRTVAHSLLQCNSKMQMPCTCTCHPYMQVLPKTPSKNSMNGSS